ncbi:uncharacterized protein LOC118467589 isoform X2 [Anopheles albimanus]|uniref:uncharacterized protein LOC118467589 isoform X2 n=1 Tax=Anopheles albimanus TaxID=7167 RepID=UPI00163F0891|nr:uncharacterized protein LOC118467589 isoform X2 [Anopheles albimanus]
MKVDKAVCTNGTLEDLGRAIQFEAVFSTLVENKILSIKRESDLKKRHKKTRLLRRVLLGGKVAGPGCCRHVVAATASNSSNIACERIDSIGMLNAAKSGQHKSIGMILRSATTAHTKTVDTNHTVAVVMEGFYPRDGDGEDIIEAGDLSYLSDNDDKAVVTTNIESSNELMDGVPRCDHFSSKTVSDGSKVCRSRTKYVNCPKTNHTFLLEMEDRSCKTDWQLYKKDPTVLPRKSLLFDHTSNEAEYERFVLDDSTSNISIELDGLSEASDMRRSIVSEPISIIRNSVQTRVAAQNKTSQYSARNSLLSAGNTANRIRILEAKSISAQNSPVLPRQKSTMEGRHLTFSTDTYQKNMTKACASDCDNSIIVDLSLYDKSQQQQQNNSTVIVMNKPVSKIGDGRLIAGRNDSKRSPLVLQEMNSNNITNRKIRLTQALYKDPNSTSAKTINMTAQPLAESLSALEPTESFNQLTAANLPVIATPIDLDQSSPVSDMVKLQQYRRASSCTKSSNSVGESKQSQARVSSLTNLCTIANLASSVIQDEGNKVLGCRQMPSGFNSCPYDDQRHLCHLKHPSLYKHACCDVELHHKPSGIMAAAPSIGFPNNSYVQCSRQSSLKEFHRKGSGTIVTNRYGYNDDCSYIMGYDINESDEEKLNKRKYKYLKRCSDPIIAFPTTSSGMGSTTNGLHHCILSRSPNQPSQIPYDDDFIYDVSLQIEPDYHGAELDSIVQEHKTKKKHRHHRHHHRHCKKKKYKRRKILVHDLDDQSVKVIDPDDLPQRARWTIIATACLLLIMCLLLVGITLRMAPIIDDMVRQENERLMRESLDRAKMIKNYTEYNRIIADDDIP